MLKNNQKFPKSVLMSLIAILLIFFYNVETTDVEKKVLRHRSTSIGELNTHSNTLPLRASKSSAALSSRSFFQKKIRSYYPNAAIKYQLPILRDAADKGDSHAACVLSHALLLCKKIEEDLSLFRYSNHYLLSLSKKEVEFLVASIASHENAASAICENVDQNDLEEIDERIYQSAALGDKSAMHIYATQSNNQNIPQKPGEKIEFLAERYSEHAESMINHAADSGDPAALLSIYITYSSGFIETGSSPRVQLERDPVKAIAAFRALLTVDDFYLKSRYTPYDIANAEKSIKRRLSTLNNADRVRLAEMEDAYILSYRAERRTSSIEDEFLNELPEQACSNKKQKT